MFDKIERRYVMCKLQGINFGYADSEKELTESPELFDSAFVDPKNYLSRLIDGISFLVLGRKGTGKTAYGAKLRRMSMVDPNYVVRPCPLSNLNYSAFESFAEQDVKGGRRFISVWKYLLFLEMVKLIDQSFPDHEKDDISIFIQALKNYGALPREDIVHTAKHLKTSNISLSIPNFFSAEQGVEKDIVLCDIDEITEIGLKIFKEAYFGDKRFFLIIDGLDDALRGNQFSSDIITGLIRAADYINTYLAHSAIHFKIIVLLRTDIFELCRDPDLTKMKRDVTINLSWNKDDLKEIVIKRIQNKYPQYKSFESFWDAFAPQMYKDKKSMTILFELTLLRPRDILQFFIECQNLYGNQSRIRLSDFTSVIASYSKEYFISEMKDELTGILPDTIVTAIPSLFSELGKRTFFEEELQEIILPSGIDITARKLLETLYQSGYIGQIRPREGGNRFVSFIHVNPYDKFSPKEKCIIHRGLVKAVNIF